MLRGNFFVFCLQAAFRRWLDSVSQLKLWYYGTLVLWEPTPGQGHRSQGGAIEHLWTH